MDKIWLFPNISLAGEFTWFSIWLPPNVLLLFGWFGKVKGSPLI